MSMRKVSVNMLPVTCTTLDLNNKISWFIIVIIFFLDRRLLCKSGQPGTM